jgi:hypothetical protein
MQEYWQEMDPEYGEMDLDEFANFREEMGEEFSYGMSNSVELGSISTPARRIITFPNFLRESALH